MVNIFTRSGYIVFYAMHMCTISFPCVGVTLLLLVALSTGCTAATVKKQLQLIPQEHLLAFVANEQDKGRHTSTGRSRSSRAKRYALASVLKLGVRDRLTNDRSNNKTTGSSFGVAVLQSIAIALKRGGLALGGAGSTAAAEGIRHRSVASSPVLAVVVTLACVLSVAAVNTAHIAPRPTGARGMRRSSVVGDTVVATVHTQGTVSALSGDGVKGEGGSSSWKGRLERWRERRGRTRVKVGRLKEKLLHKAPTFPLAYGSWWQALQDRREVGSESLRGARPACGSGFISSLMRASSANGWVSFHVNSIKPPLRFFRTRAIVLRTTTAQGLDGGGGSRG